MSLVEAAAVSIDAREENRLEQLKRTVSASRLNCFHSCRLKFYFRYVLELSKETPPALFFGKAVHWALQQQPYHILGTGVDGCNESNAAQAVGARLVLQQDPDQLDRVS